MAPRGPDGLGAWVNEDGAVGLGHRRLAIIDLNTRAAQPMLSADGSLAITFNGEIYNYEPLREQLLAKGHAFRTTSDTEVLLALYAEHGERMTEHLRGMFAFAIWDERKRAMFIARDPYGIKPLYLADDGECLRVASQVKALLAGGKLSRDRDPAGVVGFYLFGSVPEPHTRYRAIRALPAGHVAWVHADRGLQSPRAYFSIAAVLRAGESSSPPSEDALREAIRDTVRHHLVADVPVGSFLSAGVDSGALVGMMSELGDGPVHTITLAFEQFRGQPRDEAPLAERMAERYGCQHTTRFISTGDFRGALPSILEAMDQPTIDGVNTWLVCRVAREAGLKVCVSGLGGDELFGGYPSFRQIPQLVRWLSVPARIPGSGALFRRLMATMRSLPVPALRSPKVGGLLEYGGTYAGAYLLRRGLFMPWELDALLPADFVAEGLRRLSPQKHIETSCRPDPQTPFGRVAALEASLYMRNQLLRDSDWASMAHGLELRVPLVDRVLLETLAPALVAGADLDGKALLGSSPKPPLPDSIVKRKKTGFGIPVHEWLLEDGLGLDAWKRIPTLAHEGCHWARRLAYALEQRERP